MYKHRKGDFMNTLEQRITALEKEMADFKGKLEAQPENVADKVAEKIMELCKESCDTYQVDNKQSKNANIDSLYMTLNCSVEESSSDSLEIECASTGILSGDVIIKVPAGTLKNINGTTLTYKDGLLVKSESAARTIEYVYCDKKSTPIFKDENGKPFTGTQKFSPGR
jgi:hypothetical protein